MFRNMYLIAALTYLVLRCLSSMGPLALGSSRLQCSGPRLAAGWLAAADHSQLSVRT